MASPSMENSVVVLYAAPSMGHIVSMTELAKLIHRHRPNLSITILHGSDPNEPPTTSSVRSKLIISNPTINFHHLPPPSVDTTRKISRAAMAFESIRLNAPHALTALRQISTHHKITALIIDMFCSTALPLAVSELSIPTYFFFTSGAAALAAYLYMPEIDKRVSQSFRDLTDLTLEFPGLPSVPAPQMPEPLIDRDDPAYGEMVFFCSCMAKSKGILVNTFDELEPVALAAIRQGLCVPGSTTPPVYNIGPLIASDEQSNSRHECLSWLDTQPTRSVVFLCFGSRGVFSTQQLIEIASGLEKSAQRFLWVVKNPPGSEKLDFLQGFMERTKDRGMVVSKWAPQVEILRHGSVGGFATHCGWNSVLEAVMAGQPMVAWPLYAEQHLNRAALVKDMGMAVGLVEGEGGSVSGDEVARCVVEVLNSKKLREKSEIMKEKAIVALKEGGSSMVALQEVMKLWC